MKCKLFTFLLAVVLLALPVSQGLAQDDVVEITFWHAMSGSRGEVVQAIVDAFNEANDDVQINAEFKGSYAETLTAAIAAYRADEAPHIVQVYEVGTRTMLDSGAIVPVIEVSGGEFDTSLFVSPIVNYYSVGGELRCMPFNSSTAMLYYNKDIFEAAGLDPESPPQTYDELYEMGLQILDADLDLEGVITFGWPAWIFEQMYTIHNEFMADNGNGRDALATEVYFNNAFGVNVMTEWQKWAADGVLLYGGREYAPNDAFVAGQLAMLVQSTSSLGGIQKSAEFNLGTAFLPTIDEDGRDGNNVVGGGCLWTMDGFSDPEYEAIWRFFQHLSTTEQAIIWHKGTGYFPATNEAVDALEAEGWFEENPNFLTAFDQILSGENTPAAAGVLLGDFVTIRDIEDTAFEEIVVNDADPQEALDAATEQANQVLQDYVELVGE
jgi:sn-glycerol 3-phosphate transport system substrate-binding protein